MSDERRELIKLLYVNGYNVPEEAIRAADALLAALDAEKPSDHEGGKYDSPMQSVTVSYATPGAVVYVDRGVPIPPAEKTCVWTPSPPFIPGAGPYPFYRVGCRANHHVDFYKQYAFTFCPWCGGRIVEGT